MRIAVSAVGEDVSAFGACETIRLYEDDHGRVTGQRVVPVEGAPVRALERSGADVLLCGALTGEERRMLAEDGVLFTADVQGSANAAVRRYLGTAIVCDPNNNCNYCGHKTDCDLTHGA